MQLRLFKEKLNAYTARRTLLRKIHRFIVPSSSKEPIITLELLLRTRIIHLQSVKSQPYPVAINQICSFLLLFLSFFLLFPSFQLYREKPVHAVPRYNVRLKTFCFPLNAVSFWLLLLLLFFCFFLFVLIFFIELLINHLSRNGVRAKPSPTTRRPYDETREKYKI